MKKIATASQHARLARAEHALVAALMPSLPSAVKAPVIAFAYREAVELVASVGGSRLVRKAVARA
jgi:hypothetical protein